MHSKQEITLDQNERKKCHREIFLAISEINLSYLLKTVKASAIVMMKIYIEDMKINMKI